MSLCGSLAFVFTCREQDVPGESHFTQQIRLVFSKWGMSVHELTPPPLNERALLPIVYQSIHRIVGQMPPAAPAGISLAGYGRTGVSALMAGLAHAKQTPKPQVKCIICFLPDLDHLRRILGNNFLDGIPNPHHIPVCMVLDLYDSTSYNAALSAIKKTLGNCHILFQPFGSLVFDMPFIFDQLFDFIKSSMPQTHEFSQHQCPLAVVFDWDEVISFAKQDVDRDTVFRDAIYSFTRSLPDHLPLASTLKHLNSALLKAAPGKQWRSISLRVAKLLYPNDSAGQLEFITAFACHFFAACFTELKQIYRCKDHVVAPWARNLFDDLTAAGIELWIASGTEINELRKEIRLSGLGNFFTCTTGYPVTKADVLNTITSRLTCSKHKVLFIDDNLRNIRDIRQEGFPCIQMINDKTEFRHSDPGHGLTIRNEKTRSKFPGLKQLLLAPPDSKHSAGPFQPEETARKFLGPKAVLLGRILNRFDNVPIFRCLSEPGGQEAFYCKLLKLDIRDANVIGVTLKHLKSGQVPVTEWLSFQNRHVLPVLPGICAVMEPELPGKAVVFDRLSREHVYKSAQALAGLHLALRKTPLQVSSFRPDFRNGLSNFKALMDTFWRLLVHQRYTGAKQAVDSLAQPFSWLRDNGPAIWHRIRTAGRELGAVLDASTQQPVLGDYNCTNVLFNGGSISGIIDYEDLHTGPRELDAVSYCMFGTTGLQYPGHMDVFLQGYESVYPSGIRSDALGPVSRAIANGKLINRIRRDISRLYLIPEQFGGGIPQAWAQMNQLCDALDNFNLKT